MEPIDAPPVVEYVMAGEDAERICGLGFLTWRTFLVGAEREPDEEDFEVYRSGPTTWNETLPSGEFRAEVVIKGASIRVTLPSHRAYPAFVIERPGRASTACAYSGGQVAIDFVHDQGFSPDDMHTASARFEEPAR